MITTVFYSKIRKSNNETEMDSFYTNTNAVLCGYIHIEPYYIIVGNRTRDRWTSTSTYTFVLFLHKDFNLFSTIPFRNFYSKIVFFAQFFVVFCTEMYCFSNKSTPEIDHSSPIIVLIEEVVLVWASGGTNGRCAYEIILCICHQDC